MRLTLALVAGCLLAPWLPSLPGFGVLAAAAVAAGAGLAFGPARLPAAVVLGALWFLAAAQWQLDRQWPAQRAGEVASVTGTVVDLPRAHGQSARFELSVDGKHSDRGVPGRILVSWYRPFRRLEPGSRWRMDLRLEPPAGRDNPGGFDYQRHLLARRIGATGSVRGRPQLLADKPASRWLDRQRQRLTDIIQSETADLDIAALKRALGVADRSGMRPGQSALLRQTGTAHLLAISGLHVGMVAGVAGLLAGWLAAPLSLIRGRLDRRRIAVAAGLLAAIGYAGLAGFSLPTQRALVMLAVVALALLVRRAVAPGHALLLALVAVLVFDPLAPLAAGFWLSFAAVAILIWAFAWRPSRSGGWLTGLLRAQLVLMVGLAPLNIGFFGQLVPGALVANLAAIPLVGIVVLPALLLDMATMLIGLPATPVGDVANFGLAALLRLLEFVHQLPAGFWPLAGGPAWAIFPAALGAAWLIAPPGWPARWLGAVLLLPLLLPAGPRLGDRALEAWFLDVGNGQAVLVATADETTLYDTGPGDGEGGDAISGILPEAMRRLGIERIDRLVVSHAHRGHAGGLASVGDQARVVYTSGLDVGQPCVAGQGWRAGGYQFRFLHPAVGLPDLGANSSCVLHVAGPGGGLLLTGGIDSAVEARMVARFGGPNADVLQLAKGGHRSASSAAFLQAVAPKIAVASVARHDRYGRIHEEVRRRLDHLGIEAAETGRCGAIRVLLRPGREVRAESMATRRPRWWRARADCP